MTAALLLVGCTSSSEPSSAGTSAPATTPLTTAAVADDLAVADGAPAAETSLVAAITDRLALAEDVARTKWSSGAPIEDLEREAQAIAAIEAAAPAAGVDPAVAADALRGQIEASKSAQRSLHAEWTAQDLPPFAEVRDLQDIRVELDQATASMLAALATVPLPIPSARVETSAAAMAIRLADVPDASVAVAQALAPFH